MTTTQWVMIFDNPLNRLKPETPLQRLARLGLTIESYRVDINQDVIDLLNRERMTG